MSMKSHKQIVEQLHVWRDRAAAGETAFRESHDDSDHTYEAWARMDQSVKVLDDVIAFVEGRTP